MGARERGAGGGERKKKRRKTKRQREQHSQNIAVKNASALEKHAAAHQSVWALHSNGICVAIIIPMAVQLGCQYVSQKIDRWREGGQREGEGSEEVEGDRTNLSISAPTQGMK